MALALGLLAGCGEARTLDSDPVDAGLRPEPGACATSCAHKVQLCGAPPGLARDKCRELCALRPTHGQLDCLRLLECTRVAAAVADGVTVCDIGRGWERCAPAPATGPCPAECDAPPTQLSGQAWCTALCGPRERCPAGFACNSSDDPAICLPEEGDR